MGAEQCVGRKQTLLFSYLINFKAEQRPG